MAQSLNNLAALYRDQGKHADAELLYQQSLAIWKIALGPEHPSLAASLKGLADVLSNRQGDFFKQNKTILSFQLVLEVRMFYNYSTALDQ